MALIFENGIPARPEDVDLIARLAEDLAWCLREGGPPQDVIVAAPVIDAWSPTLVPQTAIIGRVGASRPLVTPTIHALSPDLGWARSLFGWYRLGRRVDEVGLNHS